MYIYIYIYTLRLSSQSSLPSHVPFSPLSPPSLLGPSFPPHTLGLPLPSLSQPTKKQKHAAWDSFLVFFCIGKSLVLNNHTFLVRGVAKIEKASATLGKKPKKKIPTEHGSHLFYVCDTHNG